MAQRKTPPVGTAPTPAPPPPPPSEPKRVPLSDIAAFPCNPTLHQGISVRHWLIGKALGATKGGNAKAHAQAAVDLADAVLEILDPASAPLHEPTVAPRQDGAAPPPVAGPPAR